MTRLWLRWGRYVGLERMKFSRNALSHIGLHILTWHCAPHLSLARGQLLLDNPVCLDRGDVTGAEPGSFSTGN